MLMKAERRCAARVSRIGNPEELENGNDHRLEFRDSIDSFAKIEYEIELRATHTLHPATIGVHGNANRVVTPEVDGVLDLLDGLENESVGIWSQRRHGIEQHADFHISLLPPRAGRSGRE